MIRRIERLLTHIALPAWLAFFGVEAFVGHLPLWACWLALLLVEGGLSISSLLAKRYHLGHAGAALALCGFGGVAGFLGFDSVFPATGAFFYAGYAIAFVLEGTLFLKPRYTSQARPWFLLIGALYACGCALSLLLAPNVAYLYAPPLVAVLPGILIAIKVRRTHGVKPDDAAAKAPSGNPRLAWALVLVLAAVAGSLPWIGSNKNLDAGLDQVEQHKLDSLEALPKETFKADDWLALGRLRFLSGRTEESRSCFESVRAIRPGDPLAGAYLASLVAIQARDGVNPVSRVRWANEAAVVLDSLVGAHPAIEEIRLIRANVYVEYPASFHKQDTVRNDVEKLENSSQESVVEAAREIRNRLARHQ